MRKTARECVCCVEEPKSENKLEGTLSTSIRIRRVLALFSISFIYFFCVCVYSLLNMKPYIIVATASGFFFLLRVLQPRRLCRWSTSKQSSVK